MGDRRLSSEQGGQSRTNTGGVSHGRHDTVCWHPSQSTHQQNLSWRHTNTISNSAVSNTGGFWILATQAKRGYPPRGVREDSQAEREELWRKHHFIPIDKSPGLCPERSVVEEDARAPKTAGSNHELFLALESVHSKEVMTPGAARPLIKFFE